MDIARKHLKIQGKVQGVGFRQNAFILAQKLGVKGWVKNTFDGAVEITVEGEPTSVDLLVEWCHEGPMHSVVRSVTILESKTLAEAEFSVFSIQKTT
ncbi:MAG: acylphosphatase [Pseudomonadota bacterium]